MPNKPGSAAALPRKHRAMTKAGHVMRRKPSRYGPQEVAARGGEIAFLRQYPLQIINRDPAETVFRHDLLVMYHVEPPLFTAGCIIAARSMPAAVFCLRDGTLY
jgi:hypothetical protein